MFEFQCEYCGKTWRVTRKRDARRFCNQECYKESVKKESAPDGLECVFQPNSIVCLERKCETCGWNPVVARARLAAMGVKDYEPYTV